MSVAAAPIFRGTSRYQVERELGRGGMGIVFEALDRERNTRVALKALTRANAINIYRLKNEFRQLADLSHPNLVSLHELCFDGGAWFFTMELVPGTTFDVYVESDGSNPADTQPRHPISPSRHLRLVRNPSVTLSQRAIASEFPMPQVTCHLDRLRNAMRQLVEAVAALHSAGKLHRDIKPSNVLVTPDGRVVVLDFGLVSNTTLVDPEAMDAERTVGGCVFGTPAYMSPEQAVGETVTPASDWYSVGAMLYEALTGQLPFDGSVLEILKQKEEREPIAAAELVEGVPDDLDRLCRDLLRRDPAERPTGPEILRRLTGRAHPPTVYDAQSSSVFPRDAAELFVGREAHLDELRAAFGRAREGHPVAVLVHGLSGMGKSALVRCFANELIGSEEAVVLRGRCYERETVPYKAFDNIVDSLSRYLMRLPLEHAAELLPRNVHSLARLFPVLKRVQVIANARTPKHQTHDDRELRNQAFAALKELLLRITDFQPLVLNIDDLQWADMDSARLLAFLLSAPEPPPLLLVGAYRRDEVETSPFLRHVLGEKGLDRSALDIREVAVDRLGTSESEELARRLMRDVLVPSELCTGIAAESEGVPFFITELVQFVKSRAEGGSTPATVESVSLEGVIRDRIASMGAPARGLLEVLSLAAGPLEQGIAIEAAELPPGERTALLALRAARLARTRGTRQTDTAEAYHDRVRETVAAGLSPERLRHIHGRLALAIETWAPGDPERLVDHYAGSGDGVRAGETAVEAAHAAAEKLAFNRAAELYDKAIDLLPAQDDRRRQLQEHLGDALANAGRGARAADAYLAAALGLEGAEARRLKRMAAQQYLRSGRNAEGIALAKELLNELGLRYPDSSLRAIASILIDRAALRFRGFHFATRQASDVPPRLLERVDALGSMFQEVSVVEALPGSMLQSRFLRYALEAGEPYRILRGMAWAAFNAALAGGASQERQARQALAKLQELASSLETPHAIATCRMGEAGTHIFLGEYGRVVEEASEAERLFRDHCAGVEWELHTTRLFKHVGILMAGGFKTVAEEAPERIRAADERDDRFGQAFLTFSLPLAQLVADQPTAALKFLDQRRVQLPPGFNNFHLWVMQRTIDAAIYRGDGAAALDFLGSQWDAFKSTFIARTPFFVMSGHSHRARAAIAAAKTTGDDACLELAARDAQLIERLGRADFLGVAKMLQAAVAYNRGDSSNAAALTAEAEELFERVGMRLYAVYQRRNRGVAEGGEAGASAVAAADDYLRTVEGITNPERWVATFSPGFSPYR